MPLYPPASDGGAAALADLTDVDLTGIDDGDPIVWDATNSMAIPGEPGASASALATAEGDIDTLQSVVSALPSTLADQGDILLSTPIHGDVIRYRTEGIGIPCVYDGSPDVGSGVMYQMRANALPIVSAASSIFNAASPALAVDGDASSQAHTDQTPVPSWMSWDLGEGYSAFVSRWALYSPPSNYRPKTFEVQGSNNNASWTTLFSNTVALPSDGWGTDECLDTGVAYRYFRILQAGWENNANTNHLLINEIEFWGRLVTPDDAPYWENSSDLTSLVAAMPLRVAEIAALQEGSIAVVFDAPAAEDQLDLVVPFACTITGVTMLADVEGSIVVDIWKDTYANFPPTDADSITAAAPPTITTAVKAQDTTLTDWTVAVAAGDILRFNVDSVATITRATLVLAITRS